MICLTCKHLLMCDWEEHRTFYCGHSDCNELDSNEGSSAVKVVPWNAVDDCSVLTTGPAWCPLEATKPLETQKESF